MKTKIATAIAWTEKKIFENPELNESQIKREQINKTDALIELVSNILLETSDQRKGINNTDPIAPNSSPRIPGLIPRQASINRAALAQV